MNTTKAADILTHAALLVSGDREAVHGKKEDSFTLIGDLWSAYLGLDDPLTATDVANMMVLLKVARTKHGRHNPDDFIDMAGYAGCGGEIAASVDALAAAHRASARDPFLRQDGTSKMNDCHPTPADRIQSLFGHAPGIVTKE